MKLPIPIIADIITVAIIIISMIIGRKRGFIKTVSGILTVIIAFSLASFAAKETAPVISEKYISPYLSSAIVDEVKQTPENTLDLDELSNLFSNIGIPEGIISSAVADVSKTLTQNIAEPLTTMTNNISARLTFGALFIIYFLILLLAVSLLFKLLNLISKLPVLNFTNRLLGLIFGLISGYLIIMVASFILNKTGTLLTDGVISESIILKHIIKYSFFSFLK